MNVYFNASLSGKKEYEENYQLIIGELRNLGHKVISPLTRSITPEDVASETANEAERYYKRLKGWVGESNVCVFEVSYPSTGIGHEITMALGRGKPVVILYVKDRDPYVLEAIPSEDLQILKYFPSSIKLTLEDALHVASEQTDTRFNFFISRKLSSYLDWVAKKDRIPRAVYLRQLIMKEMRKNKDFQS